MKIGCCVDRRDILKAAKCGFDFIDLNGKELAGLALDEVKRLAEETRGICVRGLHATVPAHIRLTGPDFFPDIVKDYFTLLGERAEIMGVRFIGIGSPVSRALPQGFPVGIADDQMREVLSIASRACPRSCVLLESLNASETNYINSLAHAYRVIESLRDLNVGLVLDVYHMALCSETAKDITPDIAKSARYMHIADPVGRRFPSDDTQLGLFSLVRKVAEISGLDEIAVEAVTNNLERDGRQAVQILKKLI